VEVKPYRVNKETIDDSPAEFFDDPDDSDDDSAVKQAPKKAAQKKATITQSVPSVPSELATMQGCTAFDVRYFFNIPDKTCY
jgi:hypothetical protein